ncbi:MAG TPA: ATP phosphoribosyltransferase regulatory subunit [Pyrinomonadaceae bacterium]|nr:ATP phosphoribosyltransferase regulatory subunit [Pyrinomonadaceae bacterium]
MSEPLSRIPAGMRYYCGPEARLRRAIETAVMSIFEGWSYEEITTPTIDYYSLFEHGMGPAQAHRAFRFSDGDGRLLAVRPDVTSLVARAAATLFAQRERPLRLCYAAPVFRQQPESHTDWRRESSQIGCELIGANSSVADLEVLAIVCEVLQQLGLDRGCSITLSDIDVFNGIAEELKLDPESRDELRRLVDTRNTSDLEQFLAQYSDTEDSRSLARLTQMPGKGEILNDARQSISNVRSRAALDRITRLWNVIESLQLTDHFEIDLGDVSRLDYYTGLTFKIYLEGAGRRIGSGGRYDGLTASFGKAEPAVGFVLELDALTDILLARRESNSPTKSEEKPTPIKGSDLAGLFRAALDGRARGERIVIDSDEVTP